MDPKRLEGLGKLACHDLADFATFGADLVVEMAHPRSAPCSMAWPIWSGPPLPTAMFVRCSVTAKWAATILAVTDYMFISVTALADADLEKTILDTAM